MCWYTESEIELQLAVTKLEQTVILKQIRIRIVFVFWKWNEYEYEYYSNFRKLFEYIRIVQIIRIRIRIVQIHQSIWQWQANLINKFKWKKCHKYENFRSWIKRYIIFNISVIWKSWWLFQPWNSYFFRLIFIDSTIHYS